MSEYKRKRFKKPFKRKKIKKNTDTIKMTNKKKNDIEIVPDDDIKIIRGKKLRRERFVKVFTAIVAVIVLSCIVLSIALPVGLYENLVNWLALVGGGSYPITISGTNVINSISNGSYYYLLTDTNISAYSNNGKIVLDELHGFANPIMSVSETRVLVYDQGGKEAYVFNLGGLVHTIETEYDIISASISRSGTVAISTHSDKYASTVSIYNKNNKQIFTWNSAIDVVNNVIVDPTGKKFAVTTIGVVAGQYNNKLQIFDINSDSADPIHSVDLGSSLPMSLANTGKGLSLACNDQYKYINWKKFTTTNIDVSGQINKFRNTNKGALFAYSLANNQSDNTVVLISKKGEKLCEFSIKGAITDIQYSRGRIYCISDMMVSIFDTDGNLLRSGNCDFGVRKFAVLSSNSIAAISDTDIVLTEIEKED